MTPRLRSLHRNLNTYIMRALCFSNPFDCCPNRSLPCKRRMQLMADDEDSAVRDEFDRIRRRIATLTRDAARLEVLASWTPSSSSPFPGDFPPSHSIQKESGIDHDGDGGDARVCGERLPRSRGERKTIEGGREAPQRGTTTALVTTQRNPGNSNNNNAYHNKTNTSRSRQQTCPGSRKPAFYASRPQKRVDIFYAMEFHGGPFQDCKIDIADCSINGKGDSAGGFNGSSLNGCDDSLMTTASISGRTQVSAGPLRGDNGAVCDGRTAAAAMDARTERPWFTRKVLTTG